MSETTPLQEAVDLQRRVTLRMAGFDPDKAVTPALEEKLTAYLQAYGDWYTSKYGEHGKPHGSSLRVVTDEEETTLRAWEQEVKKVCWWYGCEQREGLQDVTPASWPEGQTAYACSEHYHQVIAELEEEEGPEQQ